MDEPSAFEVALGHEIRAWRQRRGLTLVQLAEKSGISKATIERFENATHGTSISNTWRLADALNVPLSTIVQRAEDALRIDGVPQSKWDRPSEGLAPEDRADLIESIEGPGGAEDVLGYGSEPGSVVRNLPSRKEFKPPQEMPEAARPEDD